MRIDCRHRDGQWWRKKQLTRELILLIRPHANLPPTQILNSLNQKMNDPKVTPQRQGPSPHRAPGAFLYKRYLYHTQEKKECETQVFSQTKIAVSARGCRLGSPCRKVKGRLTTIIDRLTCIHKVSHGVVRLII